MFTILTFWFCLGAICWPCIRGLLYMLQSRAASNAEPPLEPRSISFVHLSAYAMNGALIATTLAAGTTLDDIDAAWQYQSFPYAYLLFAVFSGGVAGGTIAYFGELLKRPDTS